MFCISDTPHHMLASWNGSTYTFRCVMVVNKEYTRRLWARQHLRGVALCFALHEATAICVDIQTNELIYVSKDALLGCWSHHLRRWDHTVWVPPPPAWFEDDEGFCTVTHRLYDVAQRVGKERQALKDAFAELCGSRLSLDALRHIFRFC